MYKIFITILIFGFLYSQFSYYWETSSSSSTDIKINLPKLPEIKDKNLTSTDFFTTDNWILSEADKKNQKVKKETPDLNQTNNNTLQIISRKSNKELCKGNDCMIIRGVLDQTLLLEDNNAKIIPLKPSEVLFKKIIFKGIKNTILFFENNETNETYELKFFAYVIDTNDTNKSEQTSIKDK